MKKKKTIEQIIDEIRSDEKKVFRKNYVFAKGWVYKSSGAFGKDLERQICKNTPIIEGTVSRFNITERNLLEYIQAQNYGK